MPSSEYYEATFEILDEQARQKSVIDFIDKHQGCTAEDIVAGNKLSGRGKTFRILKNLKKENVVREEISDSNRRNKKLFLNESNPLISFPREVNKFKDYLYPLFKAAQYYRSGGYKNEVYPNNILLKECFSLFFEYLNINNYRAFVIWQSTINDKETLAKLYMLFYSEMLKFNSELRELFQPVEFGYLKRKKLVARGMNQKEYLTIAKNAAQDAIFPDDLNAMKIQNRFFEYSLDNVSRPVINFLMKIKREIYESQAAESERDLFKKTEEELEYEQFELQRQKELKKLRSKLKTIESKRKRDCNNHYPRCDCQYGSISEEYDPLTGKKTLRHIVDIGPYIWPEKYTKP
jgi:hypothetical protein